MRRLVSLGGVALCVLAGCVVPPSGGNPAEPAPPTITSFTTPGGPFTDPALVPFAWTVSDANGDDLTCRLDVDGDLTWDHVIPECQGAGSRLATPGVGSHLAILEVSDGEHDPVTTTRPYVVAAGPAESFDIELRPIEPLEPAHQAVFDQAVAVWEAVLARGVEDLEMEVEESDCLEGAPAFDGTVDDLVIEVAIRPIDGPGKVLGQAGPCFASTSDWLSRWGVMEFDSADVANMIANGTFASVIVHEMGHVLGIGTLWNYQRTLRLGTGTSNPRYVGPRGVAAWAELGGFSSVPVENTGGSGTRDSHWRESTFGNELMTGYISPGANPLSIISVASLGDLGYHVDPSAADPYLFGAALRAEQTEADELGLVLRPPVRPKG